MRGPNGDAENRAAAGFGGECGGAFGLPSPACSAANEGGRKFCYQCGSPLQGDPIAVAAPITARPQEAAAERRLVSVLFADLVGFTTLSEARDSEEVRDLLSRYFELARTLIA